MTATGEATALSGIMRWSRRAGLGMRAQALAIARARCFLRRARRRHGHVLAWWALGDRRRPPADGDGAGDRVPPRAGARLSARDRIATSLGARNGLMVRTGSPSRAREVERFIFDKTGPYPWAPDVRAAWRSAGRGAVLALAAAVESDSEHPLAAAILAAAARGTSRSTQQPNSRHRGRGPARPSRPEGVLGGPRLRDERGWALADGIERSTAAGPRRGGPCCTWRPTTS